MTIAASPSRTVLADALVRRGWLTDSLLVVGGTALVALLAQVQVPMWPVPITGQTLAVVLVGATLGTWRGAAALALYLVAGVAGAPVFTGWSHGLGSDVITSFGFVIGFIPAAALIGWLSERRWDRRPLLAVVGFGLAGLVPFLFGVPWLAAALAAMGAPHDLATVLNYGVTPFIVGGIVKWAIAAALLPAAWKALRASQR
ncbi:biotin transporter BioY [Gryllotalpicola ginsengisoli]|uniref:biotin transporter BioY n=1 Tax=Gryllotalpicola ginsengisoli TaxID=444608 RepID=UPI0003B6550C|nr:biotin transporter BioY [Gryllotalpicola ginsengisoli]